MVKRLAFLILAGAIVAPAAAKASTITFLGAAPTSGTIYYTGGAGPLEGNAIAVDLVVGSGTPANSGAALCVECQLDFVTGGFLAGDATAYVFDGGGSFAITGGIDLTGNGLLGDAGDIAAGSTLIAGTFVGNQFVLVDGTPGFGALQLSLGDGQVLSQLANYYGLSGVHGETLIMATFAGFGDVPGAFQSTQLENVIVSTPEPTSLAVLGLALLGLVGRRLRT